MKIQDVSLNSCYSFEFQSSALPECESLTSIFFVLQSVTVSSKEKNGNNIKCFLANFLILVLLLDGLKIQ